jgi:hemoglobin/transferrin/lactoferrin receptor protein
MKKTIIALWLSVWFGLCLAQTVKITDSQTGIPLKNVIISHTGSSLKTISNEKGEADISPFKDSNEINFRLISHVPLTISFKKLYVNGFKLQLVSKSMSLNEMVFSSSKWNQKKEEIPAQIAILTQKELELYNPQTAADLLGSSGKVFIQKSQQGGGSPMIRGFATNRLLYSIDGVRMNTAIFRAGNIQNVISLDPFSIDKTEVLFGPGSVIYGSDAIGGVMSFQTLSPDFSASGKPIIKGSALSRLSTANSEQTIHVDVALGFKKWAFLSSFSNNQFGDLKMGTVGPNEYLRNFFVQRVDTADKIVANENSLIQKPTAYNQVNLMQKVKFKSSEHLEFEYGFHYSLSSEYSRYDRLIRYKNGIPRSGEWNYGPQKWIMNILGINHNKKTRFYEQFSLKAAFQNFEESRIDRDFNQATRRIRIEKVDAYSINLDFNKKLFANKLLFYGIEGVQNKVTSIGNDKNIITGVTVAGPARYPQADWASYAAYGNLQWKMNSKLNLQAGLRYNIFQLDAIFDTTFYPFPYTTSNMNQSSLTGSLGLIYKAQEDFILYTNVSTAFRSPNVDDAGKVFDSAPEIVVVPNPNIKAEQAINAEIGFNKTFYNMLKIEVAAYYTLLNKALVRRNFTLNGKDSLLFDGEMSRIQAVQNAASATVYGIQANFEIKFESGFGISSDINYQKGEEELDNGTISPSRHAAPMFGVSRVFYHYKGLRLELNSFYSASKKYDELPDEEKAKPEIYAIDENGKPWSPSYYTLNFKANYLINKTFSLSAGIENILDKRYRPYSSGIVAAGRNLVLSGKVRF